MARTKSTRKNIVENIKASSKKKPKEITAKNCIPTGCTLLNLALTDRWDGGWPLGTMANIIGDSSSGKSFLALGMFPEMERKKFFDKYEFIYDDVEAANNFDMQYLFGLDEVSAPSEDDNGDPLNSEMIEDFQDNLMTVIEEGIPFAYVLDSFDALGSEQEEIKTQEKRAARKKGKEAKGTYGMEKAKLSGQILRQTVSSIEKTLSFLAIVSQTRDNIDPMSFAKKTRSGGKALKFYATHELWLANAGAIKKRERVIGVWAKVKVSKNKITGKQREIKFPIYYDYGIDDITANIEFLLHEKHWTRPQKTIDTKKFAGKMTMEKLIKHIEAKGLEEKLAMLVGEVWTDIEESLRLNRKSKYAR